MATVREWSPDLRVGPAPILARDPVRAKKPVQYGDPFQTEEPELADRDATRPESSVPGEPATPAAEPVPKRPPQPVERPIHPRAPFSDPEAEVIPWTGLSLMVALTGLFLLMAIPGREQAATANDVLDREQELGLVTALARLRRAVVAHRAERGTWPGAEQPLGSERRPSDTWPSGSAEHLATQVPSVPAEPLVVGALEPLGSYLTDGSVPVNVANGLRTVRVLRAGERMPMQPDGSSGWILDPSNGDLRANTRGRLRDSGRALFDL